MLTFQKPKECPELANKCRALLRDGVTEKDRNMAIAKLAMEDRYGFNELRPKPLPSIPEELRYYKKLNSFEKVRWVTGDKTGKHKAHTNFFIEGKVADYLDQAGKIKNENESHRLWLLKLREVLKGDTQAIIKIDARLHEFTYLKDAESQEVTPAERKEYLRDASIAAANRVFKGKIQRKDVDG